MRTAPCPICAAGRFEFPHTQCDGAHLSVASYYQVGYETQPVPHFARETSERIAERLHGEREGEIYAAATALGASSQLIQKIIEPALVAAGFAPEVRSRSGLAEFRADFISEKFDQSILVEVERGKTTDNNMDMLDFWKAHIHGKSTHLILVVPVWYSTQRNTKRTFYTVCRRLSVMFEPENYTNVRSLHIVGY